VYQHSRNGRLLICDFEEMSRPLLQDSAGMLLMGLLYMEVVKYIALVVREK
jgi:hypothetical protein